MKMLQPEQQNSSPTLKDLIKRNTEEITQRWLLAVREDRSIPSTEGLAEPLLLDAVPLVLGEILRGSNLMTAR